MEDENPNQVGESKEQQSPELELNASISTTGEMSPLNIIRTEETLSRFPIHNLAKKGNISIQIVKKTLNGEIDLRWEVSHNSLYGQARQLAYKLDTVIVNRTLEEAGRPLPKMIRLGSLNEISKKLGSQKNELKRALQQNATTAINAKIEYRDNSGGIRKLEALFTRYSVIFAGKQLPDGRKADAIYLILNEPYWEVLNNSRVRPLDYDYLKELPPAAQRFYEIVSRKLFAALKYSHPYAKLAYSEYCTYSAQQRYFDYDHFKKQMYKVHHPHKKSGYIAKVAYEMCLDEEGKPDWLMLYTPGEKARAEFQTFNGLPVRSRRPKMIDGEQLIKKSATTRRLAASLSAPESGREAVDQKLLTELTNRGVFESTAVNLLTSRSPEQMETIGDFIDYWDRLPVEKHNAGLLVSLIQKNESLPSNFETRRQRVEREAAADRNRKLNVLKQTLGTEFEEHCRQVIDRYIADQVPAEEFERRVAAQKEEDAKQPGLWAVGRSPDFADNMARHAVRKEIAQDVPPPSYEEFRRRELPRILADLHLDPVELGIEQPPAAPTVPENTP